MKRSKRRSIKSHFFSRRDQSTRIPCIAVAVLSLLIFPPAVLSADTPAAKEISLNWAGCGITKKAFMKELALAYEKKTGVAIDVAGGGATKGIRKVAAGEADMGGTCRHKLDRNKEEEAAKLVPVAWDALVVIVNNKNPVKDITLGQLMDVYEGRITNWAELGGPDQPIHLYVRKSKISGVGRTFRELVFADLDKAFDTEYVFPSSGPLEEALVADPNAIAVTGISSARKRDANILSVDGNDPSYQNIKNGEYLLYRPLYLVVNENSPNFALVNQFVDFAHSEDGKEIIRRNGTVPYLDAVSLVRKQRQQWKQVRAKRRARTAGTIAEGDKTASL